MFDGQSVALLAGWLLWCLALSALVAVATAGQPALKRWPRLFALLPLLSVLPFLPWPGLPALLPALGVGHPVEQALTVLPLPAAQPTGDSGWLLDLLWSSLLWLLPVLYLVGLCALLLRRARQYRLWRQLCRLRRPYPLATLTPLLNSDATLAALWQAAGTPATFVQPLQGSPFVAGVKLAGFGQTQLYLPDWFSQLPLLKQQLLLRHELWHLQARHPLKLLLWQLLADLAWCNPLMRYWAYQYQQACELWVDSQVLYQQPKARSYGEILLWISQLRQPPVAGLTLAAIGAVTGSAGGSSGYRQLQSRLTALQQPRTLSARRRLMWLLVLLGVTLPVAALQTGVTGGAPAQWLHPIPTAVVSSPFGVLSKDKRVAQLRGQRPHGGIDFVAPRGSPVRAIADGRVLVADDQTLKSSLGQTVVLAHGGGYQSLFAHLDRIDVKAGQWVKAGTVIGTLGASGNTTGAHLHLELALDNQKLDPASLLPLP